MTIVVAIVYVVTAIATARWAAARFRGGGRLPMQWRLNGDVTWTAPRVAALAFIPALGSIVLTGYVVLAAALPPRPGDEHMVLPVLLGMAAVFLGSQFLHLWLVDRTLRRER